MPEYSIVAEDKKEGSGSPQPWMTVKLKLKLTERIKTEKLEEKWATDGSTLTWSQNIVLEKLLKPGDTQ